MDSQGNTFGFAANDTSGELQPFLFDRRPIGPNDVSVRITHCGICHTDLHQLRGEWGNSLYPMVPGHEIVGIIQEMSDEAASSGFQIGDRVGIGFFIGSCRQCQECLNGEEQYCELDTVATFNGFDAEGSITYGGFSERIVVDYRYIVRIPQGLGSDVAAPLLCAGVTVYSSLKYYCSGLTSGSSIGVFGLGGLGHLAVQFAAAMGFTVTVFSQSASKKEQALSFGASNFVNSTDRQQMNTSTRSIDVLIDTVSAPHELQTFFPLMKKNGKIVILGGSPESFHFSGFEIGPKRVSIGSSIVGSIREIQETLDFSASHNVKPLIEMVSMNNINEAIQRLANNDVRFRFVIDIENTLKSTV